MQAGEGVLYISLGNQGENLGPDGSRWVVAVVFNGTIIHDGNFAVVVFPIADTNVEFHDIRKGWVNGGTVIPPLEIDPQNGNVRTYFRFWHRLPVMSIIAIR
jgi:hypothetical protein